MQNNVDWSLIGVAPPRPFQQKEIAGSPARNSPRRPAPAPPRAPGSASRARENARRRRPRSLSSQICPPAGDVAAPLLAKRTPYLPTPRPFQQKEIAGSPARNSPRRPAPAPPRAPGSASRARENARRRRPRSPFQQSRTPPVMLLLPSSRSGPPYLPTPRPFQQKEIAGSPARNSPRRPAPAPPRAPGSASRARENARRRRPRSLSHIPPPVMLLLPSSRSGPRTSRPRGHSSKKKSPAARPGIRRAGRRLHPRERPAPPRARGKTHEEGGRGHLSSADSVSARSAAGSGQKSERAHLRSPRR